MTPDDIAARAEDDAFFVDANRVDEPTVVLSPSGRYRLTIQTYRTLPGRWNYSRGVVARVADGAVVCDIRRILADFHHTFVTKGAAEYLIAGRSYMSQTIVDLDAGREYEPPGDQFDGGAFCWATCALSPNGNTLVVEGCIWACPSELRFFDFTDPSRGWPALDLEGLDRLESPSYRQPSRWLPDGTFECNLLDDSAAPQERALLERRGTTMHVVTHSISDAGRALRAAENE